MKKRGFYCAPVVAPACPLKQPRLRITCTTFLSEQVMDEFIEALVDVTKMVLFRNAELMKMFGDEED